VLRGFTQEALAKVLGMATKNLQRLEGGRQNLTLKTLESVAQALDVDPQTLLAIAGSRVDVDPQQSLWRALRALQRAGHEVIEGEQRQPRGTVPVMTLEAAASRFGEAEEVSVSAWVKLKGVKASQLEGRFIALVAGRSMAPTVPSGALCLFRAPVVGPLTGRTVLAQLRTAEDPETGGAYALKRVGNIELLPSGGFRVPLLSTNRDFPPVVVDVEHPRELGILAELERVLWPERRRSARSR
jgi:DNA-binding Xre family transcriptional regulator